MATVTRALPIAVLLSACALGGDDGTSVSQAISGTASISLSSASAAVTLTSDAQWSLTKTGSVSGNTVTWNISATKTATVSGQLVLQGKFTVTNTGSGPATIGNIVVNLQTRVNNKWVTVSSDIANATDGDGATTAKIHAAASSEGKASFTENTASGKLEFMDATNNTVFSLVPEVEIAAGQTRSLLFQASFNNNVLNLATGTAIRSEVIVSFGNATATGNSTANVDISGNGVIDWDEKRVRSVPSRLTLAVPPQTNGNQTPTLTDTIDDIKTTGTVTLGSVWFNLGATGGKITATVNPGSDGGTITNCAHLTSPGQTVSSGGFTFQQVGALNLQACNTQTIDAPSTCTHGTAGCGWADNDFKTWTQSSWESTGKATLEANYNTVFASTFGTLTIGDLSGFTASWTSAANLLAYLPQAGLPAPLDASSVNATSTSSHSLGGNAAALTLNVAYSDAGATPSYQTLAFGDVRVCSTSTAADGKTVSEVLALTNSLLSFGPQSTIDAINPVLAQINASFENGAVSSWAQEHLVNGTCP